MLINRVLKFLFYVMLFVSTVISVVPASFTLLFDYEWFQWGLLLTALVLTLSLYIYPLRMSKSKTAYIFYSALSSIIIIYIVCTSYILIFDEYSIHFQHTPFLLAFTIIPFYILMSLKYRSLNKINSKVATCGIKVATYGIAVVGVITAAIGAVSMLVIGAFVDANEELEEDKPDATDSPIKGMSWEEYNIHFNPDYYD